MKNLNAIDTTSIYGGLTGLEIVLLSTFGGGLWGTFAGAYKGASVSAFGEIPGGIMGGTLGITAGLTLGNVAIAIGYNNINIPIITSSMAGFVSLLSTEWILS